MTEHSDDRVDLYIDYRSSRLRRAIALQSSRAEQIRITADTFCQEAGKEEDTFEILKGLFPEDGGFRQFLRETVYWRLPRAKSVMTHQGSYHITGSLKERCLILSEVLAGWRWRFRSQEEPIIDRDEAKACFFFVCEAYADFNYRPTFGSNPLPPFPKREGQDDTPRYINAEDLRKKIEDLIQKHLAGKLSTGSGISPFHRGYDLKEWMALSHVPQGMLHVLLHGQVNIMGDQSALIQLTG